MSLSNLDFNNLRFLKIVMSSKAVFFFLRYVAREKRTLRRSIQHARIFFPPHYFYFYRKLFPPCRHRSFLSTDGPGDDLIANGAGGYDRVVLLEFAFSFSVQILFNFSA